MSVEDRFSLFPQLLNVSASAQSLLQSHSKIQFFESNQILIRKGDDVGGIYLVASGCLRVYTVNTEGNESTLYDVKAGESCLLAMNCVFSQLRYPAWVGCSSPLTKTVFVPGQAYRTLYESEPSVRNFTLEVLSQRIFNIMSLLDEALSLNMEQRIISYLLRKTDRFGKVFANHQMIASELGSAREVISRHLKTLENSGCVKLSRGLIEITSIEALQNLLR